MVVTTESTLLSQHQSSMKRKALKNPMLEQKKVKIARAGSDAERIKYLTSQSTTISKSLSRNTLLEQLSLGNTATSVSPKLDTKHTRKDPPLQSKNSLLSCSNLRTKTPALKQDLSNPLLKSTGHGLKSPLLTSSNLCLRTKNTLLAPSFTLARKTSSTAPASEERFSIVEQGDGVFTHHITHNPVSPEDIERIFALHKDDEVSFPSPEEIQQRHQTSRTSLSIAKTNLIERVCASLINNPVWFSENDTTRTGIFELCEEIASSDPEFILKVALYTRHELNIRASSNFLLAVASLLPDCRAYLKKYFAKCIVLPSDWMQVAEFYQSLEDPNGNRKSPALPSALRKVMVAKFPKFDEYQLAKYNKDKSKTAKKKEKKEKSESREMRTENDQEEEKKKLIVPGYSLKFLIRKLHIMKPAYPVMCILGKKYPSSVDEYYKCGLEGSWNSAQVGKRMRLSIPETWETKVSAKGNVAEIWEDLLDHKKLPFMAMLRNIRNMIKVGISPKHHQQVLKTLQNVRAVIRSRQFPFRFFSAYEVLSELEREIEKQDNYRKFGLRYFLKRDLKNIPEYQFGSIMPKSEEQKKLDFVRKRVNKKYGAPFAYDAELLKQYKKALDEAVRIATLNNVPPISGHTIVLCDVRDTMNKKCTTSRGIGSSRTLLEVGILLGLMCAYSCEACTFVLCAGSQFKIIELEKGGILDNLSSILSLVKINFAQNKGFLPQKYLDKILLEKIKLNNILVLSSSLMQSEEEKLSMFLQRYKDEVKRSALCFKVDLAGKRPSIQSESGILSFSGYSDQILKFIALGNADAQLNYVDTIDRKYNLVSLDEETDLVEKIRTSLPRQLLLKPWKTIHVFISSTIKDMGCERDALVRNVFPAIREKAKELRLHVMETDLRWGITGEDTRYDRNVSICLKEVRKCDIFIAMLGERYGWVPHDYGFSDEGSEWLETYPKGRSITELEIQQAAFQDEHKNKLCSFYMRDSSQIKTKIPKDIKQQFFEQNLQKKSKLKALKQRIVESNEHESNFYSAQWDGIINGSPRITSLEEFEEMVAEDLWKLLQKFSNNDDEMETDMIDRCDQQHDIHNELAMQKTYVGRRSVSSAILRRVSLVKNANGSITSIVGRAGSGKTALLSNLYQDLVQNRIVFIHFAHSVLLGSLETESLLHRLCNFLAKLCNLSDLEMQNDLQSLLGVYMKLLQKLEMVFVSVPEIYILIDDLDAFGNVDWISKLVHERITIVVTCLDLSPAHKALKHVAGTNFYFVPDLAISDKREIVRSSLGKHSKKLDESHFNNQLQVLMSKRDSTSPLYLTSICDLIRIEESYESLGSTLKKIPHDLSGALKWQLAKVKSRYSDNSNLVSAILGIVHCSSEWKISENDLYDVLCLGFGKFVEDVRALSRALVFGVLNSIKSFLTFTSEQNGMVLSIGHKIHAEVLEDAFFRNHDLLKSCHTLLAEFYAYKLKSSEKDTYTIADAMKRLPTHLARSNQWEYLKTLLTDIDFIQLKCEMGLGKVLLDDFKLLDEVKESKLSRKKGKAKKEIQAPWQEMQNFIRSKIHILSKYPDLLYQEALNQAKDSYPYVIVSEKLTDDFRSRNSKMVCLEQDLEKFDSCLHAYDNQIGNDVRSCVATYMKSTVFAIGTISGKVAIVLSETGKMKHLWAGHCNEVTALCFLSKSILVSAASDGTMCIWDVIGGFKMNSFKSHERTVTDVVVRPLSQGSSARIYVSTSHDRSLAVWDMSKYKMVTRIRTNAPINCIDFHPHDPRVAVGLWDASIKIWDVQTSKRIAVIRGHACAVSSIQFSSCGNYIASCSKFEKILRLWAAGSGVPLGNFGEIYLTSPTSLTFSQDGEYIVGAGQGTNENISQIAVWNSRLGNEEMRYQVRDSEEYGNGICCKFNSSKSLLAAGFHEGYINVYDSRLPSAVFSQKLHKSAINCVAWTPGQNNDWSIFGDLFSVSQTPELILTGSTDCTLKAIDFELKMVVAILEGHTAPVLSVDCSESWIASGSEDFAIFLWKVNDLVQNELQFQQNIFGAQMQSNVGNISQMSNVNFMPLGPKKVTHCKALRTHNGPVSCLSFNTSGTMLVSGGRDGKLAFWSVSSPDMQNDIQQVQMVQTQEDLFPVASVDPAHKDWITCCSWNDVSNHVVTGSNDSTLKIWHCPTLPVSSKENEALKTPLYILTGHSAGVASVVYRMGCIASAGGEDNSIRVWSHKGVEITSLKADSRTNCCDIALPRASDDEDLDRTADVTDAEEMDWADEVEAEEWREEHEKRKPGARMKKKTLSSEMQEINVVSAGNEATLSLWKPLAGRKIQVMNEQASSISFIKIAGEGKVLSQSTNGTIKLWNIRSSSNIPRQHGEVTSIERFLGGVATTCSAGFVYIWHLDEVSGLDLAYKAKIHSKRITAICKTGETEFATASHDATVNIWTVSTIHDDKSNKPTVQVFVHKTMYFDSPLVSLCLDKTTTPISLRIGGLNGGSNRLKLGGEVEKMPKAHQREYFIGAVYDHQDRAWETITNKGTLTKGDSVSLGDAEFIHSFRVTDKELLLGSSTGLIYNCNTATQYVVHQSRVTVILDAGSMIVTASHDCTVKLWKKEDFTQIGQFYTGSPVTSAFMLSDSSLLYGDSSGMINVLKLHRN